MRAFPFITSLPIEAIQTEGKVKKLVNVLGADLVKANQEMIGKESEKKKDILSLLCEFQILLYRPKLIKME
jgi:hypothetical protein